MTNKHNQTQPDWVSTPDTLGTGIFMIPDVWCPEPRSVSKVLVPNITYEDAVVRAEFCPVFKWVPHHVASYDSLVSDAEQCPINTQTAEPGVFNRWLIPLYQLATRRKQT